MSNTDFRVISVYDLIEHVGENSYNAIISGFSCPHDKEIEFFLKRKAIEFEKGDIARTYLVGFLKKDSFVLCGYFAIALKSFEVSNNISNTLKKFIIGQSKSNSIPGGLLGQISKNFSSGLEYTITGIDLLTFALENLIDLYKSVGLRLIFLECKDIPKLRHFYESAGFKLYCDSKGNPIKSKDGLLCYIAKSKNLTIVGSEINIREKSLANS